MERDKAYRRRVKTETISQYGGECVCCGEMKIEFLCIDHIEGGGTQHRREVGRGQDFYRWLKRNEYPEGFRVLCSNCNQSIGSYGYCPHISSRREDV